MASVSDEHLNARAEKLIPSKPEKTFLSRAEVARLFEVSPATVSRWVRLGRLPCSVTPGGRRRYPREEIQRIAREVHTARLLNN